jgi:FlaA1/EpsC-like NDP-sugar epimerase
VKPKVVFHAAAYKHVPLMDEENAWACLRNNTLGTYHAALAAAEHAATKFMAVRFGNVLGSSGSVIPTCKEQIEKGGPVTVTHPEIIRYSMTIPEAARLVLQAAAIGESGQVLVLDMGDPVKVVDLARQLIRLADHSEDEIAIESSGLRPGEKLYDELSGDAENALSTAMLGLRIARLNDLMRESRISCARRRRPRGHAMKWCAGTSRPWYRSTPSCRARGRRSRGVADAGGAAVESARPMLARAMW